MVSKVENIKNMNPRSKKVLVVSILLAVAIIGAGFVLVSSGNKKANVEGNASLPNNPGNISSVPGQSTSMRYNQIVQADNKDKAQQALQGNQSFQPTLTNNDALNNKSPLDMIDQKANAQKPASAPAVDQVPVTPTIQPVVQAPVIKPVVEAPVAPVQAPVKKMKYSSEEDLVLMTMIAKNNLPESSFMEQDYSNKNKMGGANTGNTQFVANNSSNSATNLPSAQNNQGNAGGTNAVVLAKAGDMFNAILETSINSDETSPVFAKIITGQFKGARLIGTMGRTGEKVIVTFTKINIPNSPKSYSISAIAVDPDTSRSALATDVNHHYFVKYALGLGAAFLQGYGDALQRQNTSTIVSPLGGVTTTQGQLSNSQIIKQSFGQVGDRLSSDLQGDMNRPVTVTVDAGTPIGVMLMDDLTFK